MIADQSREESGYVSRQYATQDGLSVRMHTHERYTQPKIDFVPWVLDQIAWQGDEWVIDVGAGTGQYAPETIRRGRVYVAADRYMGMLRDVDPDLIRLNLDASDLPLVSASFDVVLANHMLYYAKDLDRTCAEFARVLRPGGRLLATTNSEHYMEEMRRLHFNVATHFGYGHKLDRLREARSFTLENGRPPLARHFSRVELRILDHALVFTEAQPVVDYLASLGDRLFDLLPSELSWRDVAAVLVKDLDDHLAKHGVFEVSKRTGVFVCHLKI